MEQTHMLVSENINFTFLKSGDIKEISYQHTMMNQVVANGIDGSMNQLYLRVHEENGIQFAPMIGTKSRSHVSFGDTQVKWTGKELGIHYEVTFTLAKGGVWFWDVQVEGTDKEVDVIYGQDVGLADKGAVQSNEAYMAQYLDHRVFENADGSVAVCSRQNQPQHAGFPYLQQGTIGKASGYATDGFQFFGLSYKETNVPEALSKALLPNEIYQYEFAYTALQSERVLLQGDHRFVFYGLFKENHAEVVTVREYEEDIQAAWKHVQTHKEVLQEALAPPSSFTTLTKPLHTLPMTTEEVEAHYPDRHNEEWDGTTLLSFFTASHEHVVLKEKELLMERPHGHIIMSGNNHTVKDDTITTTSFMYGVFNSQLVIGNTSFHKMLSNQRNHLNVLKTSGQRIYVEVDETYYLLTMPSWFELGVNYSKWYYKTETDVTIVTNYAVVDAQEINLTVESASGRHYRYLITNQVTMNNNEYEVPFHFEVQDHVVNITADEKSNSAENYPHLAYKLTLEGAVASVGREDKLGVTVEDSQASLLIYELEATDQWRLVIQGSLQQENKPVLEREFAVEVDKYRRYYLELMNGFSLSMNGKNGNDTSTSHLQKFNATAWWYTHNMLVHFSVPHGLEQYGGAAWGVRDVCQGPTEFFMAMQKYGTVKEIIQTVFSHQYVEDGSWPQWFMFDRHYKVQQYHSHGDVIVWPLKVIGDYLAATNDYSILQEPLPYTSKDGYDFTDKQETLLDHMHKAIDYIKNNFLHDTFLSSYGDGDWDDTLQPANQQLKQYMASSWTVALTYQVLSTLADVLHGVHPNDADDIQAIVEGIQQDYNEYVLKNDVIPGFLYMEEPGKAELMLHPSDTKTGIQYRLLPINRSIISELFSKDQAAKHYDIVKKHLACPDGVRLMSKPAHYNGGESVHFKRAEQASNFGREIGLQYVHAHIRFVEAMAKLGNKEEVWNGLEVINPIGIQDIVHNAERRQSNAYFSSSDGNFKTRYEAEDQFHALRTGTVGVKGGWRIYSSGPGIYMNQLISNGLGIRFEAEDVIIDPVLPTELDGLHFHFRLHNYPVTFVYHMNAKEQGIKINNQAVEVEQVSNRYRACGMKLSYNQLKKYGVTSEENVIELFIS
ncbi:GH36-type glycosyl hydrolase domain-containing protein [Longirhabdus pacifica]|uniref:GH36-type glycosyl hydrolase domain-containing protein n=1 Tax=Longirhabdus pacifica TaxID=2305227 RepID=UPI001008C634|nr:cellobiose phosphorylase [Longirhabdus pacifica]